MYPSAVLSQYIFLCNPDSVFLQYHLTKNSVLEWFGRTIRGRHKIQQFFRYDICQQYELNNFKNAQICGPIESRAAHMQTNIFTEEDDQVETTITCIDNAIDANSTTPPHRNLQNPGLPQVTRGKDFLPFIEDIDDDIGISIIPDAVTPPPRRTPEPVNDEPKTKRIRSSIDVGVNICTPLPNVDDYFKTKPINVKRFGGTEPSRCSSPTTPSNLEVGPNQTNSNFSDLMYMEARGIVQRRTASKHRGVSTPNYIHQSSSSPNDTSHSDRDTILKISYRYRLHDQHIQIALIIYEPTSINPSLRRNLLMAFDDTDMEAKSPNAESQKLSPGVSVRRKTPLRRNLRLF